MPLLTVALICHAASAVHPASQRAAAQADSRRATRPNVLFIVADDMGYGDIRSHGNEKIDTPVLDQLAAGGARFERFFVAPLCAPTRASLLTGRYPLRTGTAGVTRGLETMRAEEVTIAEALKRAGYATGIFGKWHNGQHYPNHPRGQGFDEFFGFSAGHWNNYFDTTLEHNGRFVKTKGYITDVLTDAAIRFIENNRARPFFAYVPYNAPHSPYQVPDRYFTKYKARGLDDTTASVYGMVENIDENIGRLLRKLDESNLTDDTIVIFMTDNGPQTARYNGGMKGRKGSVEEGGVRVPFFLRWPGQINAGMTVKNIAAHIDLLPTIDELTGTTRLVTLPLDGRSLVPLLKGKAAGWTDRMLFTHPTGGQAQSAGAVRTERWRGVYSDARQELYDMAADPGQTKNVAAAHPEAVRTLRAAYEASFKDVTPRGVGRPSIPVGYAQAPTVELPAPEAYLTGGVKWFGEAGYANDWITNWTSTDDRIAWELDVVRAGRYEVTLRYACAAEDINSKVRVEVGGSAVEGTVGRAHDPKPLPSPDRVPRRGEVYEKVWALLTLGTVRLDQGRTRLSVGSLGVAGKRVMDLKAVDLRRVR
ncbi:MAG: arylsulfatase [Acidobacteriota bacterium]|nr:arylsulfatase [Acidobacteriota bacterium]